MTQRVDMRANMPAEYQRFGGGADTVVGCLPVSLVEAVQERRMIRMVRHARVVRLCQIDDARLLESLQQLVHCREF